MKKNVLENVIGFIFKYIWGFCALLIILEVLSVTYTAGLLVEQTANGTMQAVSGEISGRVDGVLRLLNGIAADTDIGDTTKPLFDRAIKTLPYQKSYDLYMIALTDEDVNVISADEKAPPKTNYSLIYRDYMQRLYATGVTEITDVFVADADNKTLNYTIAVPLMRDDIVAGSVFGSIYFEDIEAIVSKNWSEGERDMFLLSSANSIMAAHDPALFGTDFSSMSKKTHFFNCSLQNIESNMQTGTPGSCWEWGAGGLLYTSYQRVAPTSWTIMYRVHFASVMATLLPVMCMKILFYILLCVLIFKFGRGYLMRRLAEVNHLLNRMATMQKELFESEQPDYDNLLELTQTGLTDQLTGLATRAILFKKMIRIIGLPNAHGAVVFLDLDDLKRINDTYGHDGGDAALIQFSQILKDYEKRNNGIAVRYGGDEFIVVFDDISAKESAVIIEKLCKDLNTTITSGPHTFSVHSSLGVSLYPDHGMTPEDLICKADLALYVAKNRGKNQCAYYADECSSI